MTGFSSFAELFGFCPTIWYHVRPCSANSKLYKNSRSRARRANDTKQKYSSREKQVTGQQTWLYYYEILSVLYIVSSTDKLHEAILYSSLLPFLLVWHTHRPPSPLCWDLSLFYPCEPLLLFTEPHIPIYTEGGECHSPWQSLSAYWQSTGWNGQSGQ